eukprot:c38843_g1_i1 orf=305-679(+)
MSLAKLPAWRSILGPRSMFSEPCLLNHHLQAEVHPSSLLCALHRGHAGLCFLPQLLLVSGGYILLLALLVGLLHLLGGEGYILLQSLVTGFCPFHLLAAGSPLQSSSSTLPFCNNSRQKQEPRQ